MTEADYTNATITGLIAGVTYSVNVVANSTTVPSNETTAPDITIGMYTTVVLSRRYVLYFSSVSHHLPHLLLSPHRGWRDCHSHLLCHSA